eukprot:366518-Chlamydomonas_euryale.AAC.1
MRQIAGEGADMRQAQGWPDKHIAGTGRMRARAEGGPRTKMQTHRTSALRPSWSCPTPFSLNHSSKNALPPSQYRMKYTPVARGVAGVKASQCKFTLSCR